MRWVVAIIAMWLVFVCSLSAWWMIFGLNTIDLLAQSGVAEGSKLLRQQKMLIYEGSVLVLFQVFGAITMLYFTFRFYRQKTDSERFFASLAHDLKTSLFKLQIYIEKLVGQNKIEEQEGTEVLGRVHRLHLNLENALDAAIGQQHLLFIENISISDIVADLHSQWTGLQIEIQGEGDIRGDRKALKSIFNNLLHNSMLHGQAQKVILSLQRQNKSICLVYQDDGGVFEGNLDVLGNQPQHSHQGSGFGLYLVRYWIGRMKGNLMFKKSSQQQLIIEMTLPEAL